METPQEIKERRNKLTEAEVTSLRNCVTMIESLIDSPEVTYTKLRDVNNLYSVIRIFNEAYSEKVINLLREGNRLS